MVYISEILAWILFIVSVIAIILIIAFRVGHQTSVDAGNRNIVNGIDVRTDAFIQQSIDEVTKKIGWSKITPTDNASRNTCLLYTFPSTMSGNQAIIGQPTLNKNVINNITPSPMSSCIDSDQIVAQQVQRSCENPDLGCIGYDGANYLQGQIEILYQACKQPASCSDTLALVGLQFNSNNLSSLICIQGNGNSQQGLVSSCDVGNPNQLWRIDRADPTTLKNNVNGPFARIVSRTTNLCLGPLGGTAYSGAPIGLSNCGINSGYVWWVFPPFVSDNGALPQQLVYTTSVDPPPKSNKALNTYLQNNTLFSLFMDSNNRLVLLPMIISNIGDPNANNRNTQILDLTLYNLLLKYDTYDPGNISYPAADRGF